MSLIHTNRSSPRFRFTVRTLLLGVAVAAILFALAHAFLLPWYHERRQIVSVSDVGAQVFTEPRGQYFVRQFVGDSLSQRAIYVHLDDPRVTDEWLQNLHGLKHIEVLSIKSPNLTDEGLIHLRDLPHLMSLNLVDTKVTESGIQNLRQALPSLRLVQCRNTEQ